MFSPLVLFLNLTTKNCEDFTLGISQFCEKTLPESILVGQNQPLAEESESFSDKTSLKFADDGAVAAVLLKQTKPSLKEEQRKELH